MFIAARIPASRITQAVMTYIRGYPDVLIILPFNDVPIAPPIIMQKEDKDMATPRNFGISCWAVATSAGWIMIKQKPYTNRERQNKTV